MKLRRAIEIADSTPSLVGSDKVREALDKHGAELLQEGIVGVLRRLTDHVEETVLFNKEMYQLIADANLMLEKAEDVSVEWRGED